MENLVKVYKGKKVLITGHTGFKGSWLTQWLLLLGADVCGYALPPETSPSLFNILNLKSQIPHLIGDIRDFEKLKSVFIDFKPEIVFHLAAQPIVSVSYDKPIETYETNVIGTLNVLEAARNSKSVEAFVNITTDKCYENLEKLDYSYKENDKLGGYDMYSSSKACSEILTSSYRQSFLKNDYALASARAGNVLGGGDWAVNRIIPDCVRACFENSEIKLRNPLSVRPWQFVLEPLYGYLLLGAKLLTKDKKYAGAFNFGPDDCKQVIEVVTSLLNTLGKGSYSVNGNDGFHEACLLKLDSAKAEKLLEWKPVLTFDEMMKMTSEWYIRYYNGSDMVNFTKKQINEFQKKACLR